MNKLAIALLSLCFLTIVSCQKETNDQPDNQLSADTLLLRVISYDTINPHEHVSVTEFFYDDQDRVTETKYSIVDTLNGSAVLRDQFSLQYAYTGTDKKPFKTSGWTRYLYTDWDVYHFYDNKGQVIRDSLGDSDGSKVLGQYHYAGDKLTISSISFDGSGQIFLETKDSLYFAGGNVSKAFLEIPMTQEEETAFDYFYDDKINPLSKLNIAIIGFDKFPPIDKFWELPFGLSKNNIIRRLGHSRIPGSPIITQTWKFTYNKNNLPVYGVFERVGHPDEGLRVRYEYTK